MVIKFVVLLGSSAVSITSVLMVLHFTEVSFFCSANANGFTFQVHVCEAYYNECCIVETRRLSSTCVPCKIFALSSNRGLPVHICQSLAMLLSFWSVPHCHFLLQRWFPDKLSRYFLQNVQSMNQCSWQTKKRACECEGEHRSREDTHTTAPKHLLPLFPFSRLHCFSLIQDASTNSCLCYTECVAFRRQSLYFLRAFLPLAWCPLFQQRPLLLLLFSITLM